MSSNDSKELLLTCKHSGRSGYLKRSAQRYLASTMTSPNRSKKSPTPKADASLASRDLTPSEIESLREDARQSLEEMRRLDAEEESRKKQQPMAPAQRHHHRHPQE